MDKRRAKREAATALPRRRRRRGRRRLDAAPSVAGHQTPAPLDSLARAADRVDVAVLISPAAGRGRARAARRRRPRLPSGPAGLDAARSCRPRTGADAERQAAEAVAAGTGAVVAVGGDGTAHAALQAVAGTTTPLAVVPAGTGNDLALALGIPRGPGGRRPRRRRGPGRPGRAPDHRRRPHRRPVVGDRALLRLRLRRHRPRQPAALAPRPPPVRRGDPRRAGAAAAAGARSSCWTASRMTVPVTLVAVGNTSWYGGGMKVCPGADPSDGLFDVTVVGPLDPPRSSMRQRAEAHRGHAHRERRGHRAPGGAGGARLARRHHLRRRRAGGPAARGRRVRARGPAHRRHRPRLTAAPNDSG